MQFLTLIALTTTALAAPTTLDQRQVPVCTGGQPLCCATDVLNLADLDCATRTSPQTLRSHVLTRLAATTPLNTNEFIDICSSSGQQAKCCVLPILGQALFCTDVNPSAETTVVNAPAEQ